MKVASKGTTVVKSGDYTIASTSSTAPIAAPCSWAEVRTMVGTPVAYCAGGEPRDEELVAINLRLRGQELAPSETTQDAVADIRCRAALAG